MTDLEWLWPQLDKDEERSLRSCLAAFDAPEPETKQVRDAALQVEELEKRYVPKNATQRPPDHLIGRVLVSTVGMRPLPIILSILLLKPKRIYLLHSRESRRVAENIRDDRYVQEAVVNPQRDIFLKEISLTNAPENYSALQEIARQNRSEPLVVDVSGGVKVMGVSLAAAAFWQRIPVIYQIGEEVAQTVKPFSEQLTELKNPYEHFGSTEMRSLEQLFHLGEYDAALAVAAGMKMTIGDTHTLARLGLLEEFITVYRDWDAFEHSRMNDSEQRRLATRLRNVIARLGRFGESFADAGYVEANLAFLSAIENSWKPNERNLSDEHRLVDILAAAKRRASVGKFDDAVARLYRCLEMSATVCLVRDFGVVRVEQPVLDWWVTQYRSLDEVKKLFKERARFDLNEDRLGLKEQMTLLGMGKSRPHTHMADVYRGMESSKLMEQRNRSTLAHGTVAVDRENYNRFESKTLEIVMDVFSNSREFEVLLQQATHPDIHVEF